VSVYVGELGVEWCVRHHGVVNEDTERCDMFDPRDPDEPCDDDGEPLPCDTRPLVYIEAGSSGTETTRAPVIEQTGDET
jgi:hypothetical protein